MLDFQSSIEPVKLLAWQDWLVFASILVLTVVGVVWGQLLKKRQQAGLKISSAMDYLIMGRQLSLPLFVATLVATWYGGVIGVTQIAFEHGICNFIVLGSFWYLSYLVFAWVMIKRVRKFQAITLPQLIQRLVGPKSARLAVFLLFSKALPITYAMSMGILIEFLFGISYYWGTALGVGFVVCYSMWGGFRSVVFSDLVQFIAMCVGIGCVVVFSYLTFGGYGFLKAHLPDTHFSLLGNFEPTQLLVWFFIIFSTTFLHPAFYQRCFAAKNDEVARRGIFYAMAFWIFLDFCMTVGAMYARAVLPDAHLQNAYLVYSFQVLPLGFKGLFLAALVAMILSTLDSFLFVASATLSFDMMQMIKSRFRLSHQWALGLTALITILIAWHFEGCFESSWRFLKSCFSGCLLGPLLWSYCMPESIRDEQFFAASCSALVAMLIWVVTPLHTLVAIDHFYIGAGVSLLVLFGLQRKWEQTLVLQR